MSGCFSIIPRLVALVGVSSALRLGIGQRGGDDDVGTAVQGIRSRTRLIITEQCGTFDLLTATFVRHSAKMLGVPITILQACNEDVRDKPKLDRLREDLRKNGVDVFLQFSGDKEIRAKGEASYTGRSYPYISRSYAVYKYLQDHVVKEDVLVIVEYDFVWNNVDKFWKLASMVQEGELVGTEYNYLKKTLQHPEYLVPAVLPDGRKSRAYEVFEKHGGLMMPQMVPAFIHKHDLKKISEDWFKFTDELLYSKEMLNRTHDRLTDMYSFVMAAANHGLVYSTKGNHGMFTPGMNDIKSGDGTPVLLAHFQVGVGICGKNLSKAQYIGSFEKACKRIKAPPDVEPGSENLKHCTYGSPGSCDKGDGLRGLCGGGGLPARDLALKMWQTQYGEASAICDEMAQRGELVYKEEGQKKGKNLALSRVRDHDEEDEEDTDEDMFVDAMDVPPPVLA